MIRIEGLSKQYAGQEVLDEVSFILNKGERIALVGRNGCGKTTLFRIISGEESPDGGEVFIPRGYRIGFLQQHLQFSEPTIVDEVVKGLENPDERYKAEALLSGLGFSEEQQQQPASSFSGGFQLRVHLASVLASEPDCLLLDEPTNYLDVVAIRWFERFLRNWAGECLIISHDRSFLDSVSTHTMGIHRHKLLKVKDKTPGYYEQLVLREEHHERTRQNIDKKRAHMESFIRRFGAKNTKAKQAESRRKALSRMPGLEKLNSLQQLDFTFCERDLPGKQLVKAWNLFFRYPGMDHSLIEGVSLEVLKGDRIAIMGKNGSGKSTLLRLLAGDLKAESGKIKLSENCAVGYFGQTNIERLDPGLTIEETVARANPELRHGDVRAICGLMMFPQQQMEKRIGVLSGGEKARVLLGKLIASPCNLLLLDEPSNHLDIESVEALQTAIECFSGGVVVVSHSEELLRRVPNKLVVCREGEQEVILGNYDDFLEKGGWEEEAASRAPSKRKVDRRRRAEIIQARAKVTRPIEKEITKQETAIDKLEKQVATAEEALATAEGEKVMELSRRIGQANKGIEEHFSELERLHYELEEARAPFEAELAEE